MEELRLPIYLDHHATTPLDPRVLDEMMPYLTESYGNASSMDHSYGYEASMAVESARERIARAVGAKPDEIIFTSGATESDNLALLGAMSRNGKKGDHLITCSTEHKAVLETAEHLKNIGKQITYLPVDQHGKIDLATLESAITDRTVLISVMVANNEIGTIQDIGKIGNIAHERGLLFHTDAAQAVGHIPVNVEKMNIDMMSISAHKMYGPKGVGAIYVRRMRPRVKINPIVHGGGQERGLRPGTLNVPAIVGFGKAIEIATQEMDAENARFGTWSRHMLERFEEVGGKLNGHPEDRLPANLSVMFQGIEGKAIINSVSKKVALSAGSACTTDTVEPSHVLLALGLGEEDTHSSIRVGMGRFNTEDEIHLAIDEITDACKHLVRIRGPILV